MDEVSVESLDKQLPETPVSRARVEGIEPLIRQARDAWFEVELEQVRHCEDGVGELRPNARLSRGQFLSAGSWKNEWHRGAVRDEICFRFCAKLEAPNCGFPNRYALAAVLSGGIYADPLIGADYPISKSTY